MIIRQLDLAAYLVTKGYTCKVKYIHATMGEFTFSNDCEKSVRTFHTGEAQVNLLKFIANRLMLKKQLTDAGVQHGLRERTTTKYKDLWNTTYYYLNNENKPLSAIFGKAEIHASRKDQGNYYKTLDEARQAAALIK